MHGLQIGLVEQMARKLRAGARQVRPVDAVLLEHAPDPDLRPEDQREQQQARDAKNDRHGSTRLSGAESINSAA